MNSNPLPSCGEVAGQGGIAPSTIQPRRGVPSSTQQVPRNLGRALREQTSAETGSYSGSTATDRSLAVTCVGAAMGCRVPNDGEPLS